MAANEELNDGYKWPSHSHTAHPSFYMEYWYFNFTDPETGVGGIIGFGVVNPADKLCLGTAAVVGAVFDGRGGEEHFTDAWSLADFSARTDCSDVKIGTSGRLRPVGDDGVHVQAWSKNGKVQIDLHFEQAFQPVLETIDARDAATPWAWNSWLIYMPSARVRGTATMNGTTYEITDGGGYHDHSWGSWLLPVNTWAWAVWSVPDENHAGVIGYHCAFDTSQAFVLVPDGKGGQHKVDFEESTMVFTPKKTARWNLLWKYPTEVQFQALDHATDPQWRIDITWTVTATASLWQSPAIIFEEACTFEGAIYQKVDDSWEIYQSIDGVLGHSESVDTWYGDGALTKKKPTPG